VEIWRSALLEGQLELNVALSGRDVATWHGLEDRLPGIGPKPGHGEVSVVQIEQLCRERVELWRGLLGKIDYLPP
jgi:hypothetical protein